MLLLKNRFVKLIHIKLCKIVISHSEDQLNINSSKAKYIAKRSKFDSIKCMNIFSDLK